MVLKEIFVDVGVNVIELPESANVISFGNDTGRLSIVVEYQPHDKDMHNRHIFVSPYGSDYFAQGFEMVGSTHYHDGNNVCVVRCHQRNFKQRAENETHFPNEKIHNKEFSLSH